MDIRKIKKLIDLLNESGMGEIEVTSGEESVRISRGATAATQQIILQEPTATSPAREATTATIAPPEPPMTGHNLLSPMVGTAYLASTPGAKPFVDLGQHVCVGDTVCIIEAMKMFNEIEADKAGIISARLVQNGEPIEYEQPLFVITPDE